LLEPVPEEGRATGSAAAAASEAAGAAVGPGTDERPTVGTFDDDASDSDEDGEAGTDDEDAEGGSDAEDAGEGEEYEALVAESEEAFDSVNDQREEAELASLRMLLDESDRLERALSHFF